MSNDMKKENPYISVIMPVYNVEKYLKTALDSILNNTFKNIELVCIDDGSTDHSMEILEFYANRDKRVKVLKQNRKGPSAARNAGLEVATGQFISFVDSDDFVSFNAYEVLYDVTKGKDIDLVIFGANAFPAEEVPEWIWNIINTTGKYYENCNGAKIIFEEPAARPFLWLHLVKRSLLEKPKKIRFDETMILGEDQLFQFSYFLKAKNIAVLGDKLYNYRISRNGSLMQMYSSRKIQKVETHLMLVKKIIDCWKAEDVFEYQEDHLITWIINFLYYSIVDLPLDYKIKYAKKIIMLCEKNGCHYYLIDECEKAHYEELREWSTMLPPEQNESNDLKEKIEKEKYEIQETLKSKAFHWGRKMTNKSQRMDMSLFEDL